MIWPVNCWKCCKLFILYIYWSTLKRHASILLLSKKTKRVQFYIISLIDVIISNLCLRVTEEIWGSRIMSSNVKFFSMSYLPIIKTSCDLQVFICSQKTSISFEFYAERHDVSVVSVFPSCASNFWKHICALTCQDRYPKMILWSVLGDTGDPPYITSTHLQLPSSPTDVHVTVMFSLKWSCVGFDFLP